MTEVLILILLGLAGYLLYKALRKKPKAQALPQRTDLANLTIKDASRGDNIILSGAGQSYEDLSFTVDRLNRYESNGEEWFELSGLSAGKRVFLEWSEDDELEVTIQRQGGLHLEAIGASEEDLVRMDEETIAVPLHRVSGEAMGLPGKRRGRLFQGRRPAGRGVLLLEVRMRRPSALHREI